MIIICCNYSIILLFYLFGAGAEIRNKLTQKLFYLFYFLFFLKVIHDVNFLTIMFKLQGLFMKYLVMGHSMVQSLKIRMDAGEEDAL